MLEENGDKVSVLIEKVDLKTKIRWDIIKAEHQFKNSTEAFMFLITFYIKNKKANDIMTIPSEKSGEVSY